MGKFGYFQHVLCHNSIQGVERYFADQSVGCEPDSVIQQGRRPTKLLEDGYFCLKLPGRENSPGPPGRRLRGRGVIFSKWLWVLDCRGAAVRGRQGCYCE